MSDARQTVPEWIARGVIGVLMGLLAFFGHQIWADVQVVRSQIGEIRIQRERDAGERALLSATVTRLESVVARLERENGGR